MRNDWKKKILNRLYSKIRAQTVQSAQSTTTVVTQKFPSSHTKNVKILKMFGSLILIEFKELDKENYIFWNQFQLRF
jgi:hypothetical protein